MNKLKSYAASKRGRDTLLCFGIVIIAYIIVQAAIAGGGISSQIKGLLVPICAYVVMAISLNLTSCGTWCSRWRSRKKTICKCSP